MPKSQPGAKIPADAVLKAAQSLALDALQAGGEATAIGQHLGFEMLGEHLGEHRFEAKTPGYRGWYWSVVITRLPKSKAISVCEVNLLAGTGSLIAPAWVPWSERLKPGDLSPRDVLPFIEDDERLMPGYEATDDQEADAIALYELGLGRPRVLSQQGRDEAIKRWQRNSQLERASRSGLEGKPQCSNCGFLMLVSGSARSVVGVCANEWSPQDGKVVALDFLCGAHSETQEPPVATSWPAPNPEYDDVEILPGES